MGNQTMWHDVASIVTSIRTLLARLRQRILVVRGEIEQRFVGICEQIMQFANVCIDEMRLRFLTELQAFFPESLFALQCHNCLRDRYCWFGYGHGLMCSVFFLKHTQCPTIAERFARVCRGTIDHHYALAWTGDYESVIFLCAHYNINMQIFSRPRLYDLRQAALMVMQKRLSEHCGKK